jgi:hypothetical protein
MKTTVFFSWQTDTPTREGRNFIEKALKNAIKKLACDTELEEAIREELEMDKDTLDVPGSPAIVDTILKKIDYATIFLADLTFIGKRPDGRPTPNPNVLIEYGWALKSLGLSRMVTVMNTTFGEPTRESMPKHPVNIILVTGGLAHPSSPPKWWLPHPSRFSKGGGRNTQLT